MTNLLSIFNKKSCLVFIFIISILITGCEKSAVDKNNIISTHNKQIEIIQVEKGNIVPTFSSKSEIKKSAPFIVTAKEKGYFEPSVEEGREVKKGDILGYINQAPVISPADGVINKIFAKGKIPKNYPLFEISYLGFSLNIKISNFNASGNTDNLKAKFQIQNGIGPEEILAVVLSSEDTTSLECLISHENDVQLGQQGIVVVVDEIRKDVMRLPLSAVAGRNKSGTVTKKMNGELKNVKVELGATDGAYIEIISGVNVGDEIYSLAPNLDIRE